MADSQQIPIEAAFQLAISRNYSGTLTPTNRKIFYIFINNLPIYKSFQ